MPYLVDTNILLRLRHRAAPEHPLIRRTIRRLLSQGDPLYFTSQNLVEFWNVCTRPATAGGGFGLTLAETGSESKARRTSQIAPTSARSTSAGSSASR